MAQNKTFLSSKLGTNFLRMGINFFLTNHKTEKQANAF